MRLGQILKKSIKRFLPESFLESLIYVRRRLISPVRIIEAYRGNAIIDVMVICVGQRCNFRCRDCGNMAPYSPKNHGSYPIEEMKEDVNMLFQHIRGIKSIQIQGGEPFLYEHLGELLDYLGGYSAFIDNIYIASNGSILPKEEILESMVRNHIGLRISDYGISHEKAKEVRRICEKQGIHVRYYEFAEGDAMWYRMGRPDDTYSPDENISKRFFFCAYRTCLTLENGRLYHCSRAYNAHYVQNFAEKKKDYVDLRQTKELRKKIAHYLTFTTYMEACRYCNGSHHAPRELAAAQMEKQ
ncbi:MAG: radical SAM protein [Lachnospiraceae bacterium]|nr:radical SAM protein [Lachnospiraceae bacterium]